jgi:rhomboid protease GluP
MFGYAPAVQRLFGRLDFAKLVTIACVALYVLALALQPDAILQSFGLFSFLSPGSRALFQLGMTGGPAWRYHWWWTLLTAIYLHGGLLHIFFNVMWIRNLGPTVESVFGTARAFVIFSVAGAAGFLVSNLATGHPSIGASGSIFGLLAALIVYGRRRGHGSMTTQLYQWAVIMFIMGFVMPSVNNWAHGGGFAGGWVAAEAMAFSDERRESLAVQIFALLLLGLTVAGFVMSFVKVTSMLMAG